MNLLKTLTIGAVAAAMTSMASAATITLHVAGSTAFRAPVECSIINYLGGTSCHAVYNGSSLLGGLGAIFKGTVGSNTVIVECNWTGSMAGVIDLATGNQITFPKATDTTIATQLTTAATACTVSPYGVTTPASAKLASGFATELAIPDAIMSDSYYTSVEAAVATAGGINISAQPGTIAVTPLTGDGLATLIDNTDFEEAGSSSPIVTGPQGYLGTCVFEWVLGNIGSGTTVPFTNITQQTAAYLISNGSAPFSLFGSTVANASSTFAYLIGRNEDSGTRIVNFAEPQLGFIPTPLQYLLTFSGGTSIANTSAIPAPAANNGYYTGGTATFVTKLAPWTQGTPINTESTITWPNNAGHGGYVSGGDVAKVISTPVNQTAVAANSVRATQNTSNSYFIGYISIGDAGGYVTPGATTPSSPATNVTNGTTLTYNGVPFSVANVNNGSYSLWCSEHMYYIGSGTGAIGSSAKAVADAIANGVATTFVTYDGNGIDATTITAPAVFDGAGVKLSPQGTAGSFTRALEGGIYSINY